MKPANMTLAAIALFTTLSVTCAYAVDRQAGSFAAGGVLGIMVDNGLERHRGNADQQLLVAPPSSRYERSRSSTPRHNYRSFPHYPYYKNHCRQIVILRDGRHGTRRVLTTVCNDNRRYPYDDHHRYRNNGRLYR